MADTTATFDKLVFDFAFDIIDVAPVIFKVLIERQYHLIAAGQAVPITLYLINNMTTPGKRYLFTPAIGPFITIYKPDSTIQQAATVIPPVETGIFTYLHQTDPTDAIGPYSAIFTASNGDTDMISKKYHLFTIGI